MQKNFVEITQDKEKEKMTTLQKEQMESLYNLYERKYWLCPNEYERALGAMKALREVAKIFGYRFESYGVETVNRITCSLYRLEEI